MMKITSKILNIPPFVSTAWDNISALYLASNQELIVSLLDGTKIEVPHLTKETITLIFDQYAQHVESKKRKSPEQTFLTSLKLPIKEEALQEPLLNAMEHNPEQANLPPLPPAVLKKISLLAKSMGLDDASLLPKSEPGCNCVFCQVTNAFHADSTDEEVTAEDLTFKDWEVVQLDKKLYQVTSPLDQKEQYQVFLGNPLGCTCGQKNCEHIQAVLKT